MSSLVRKIQKNIAKAQGFRRNKDGFICDSNGDVVSKHWPQVSAPTKGK